MTPGVQENLLTSVLEQIQQSPGKVVELVALLASPGATGLRRIKYRPLIRPGLLPLFSELI